VSDPVGHGQVPEDCVDPVDPEPPRPIVAYSRADPERAPASELLAEMTRELNALYGSGDRLKRPQLRPTDLAPPHGTYLVGALGGQPVAGGGVRRLDDGLGEIKRMYVRPRWRGLGIAGGLLIALESAARGLGYATVRLDTGPLQPHAQRLYERAGYRQIPAYNDNPFASFWGEKSLGG
jgi:GNAT superfamily N-acetyltransferase